MNNDLKSRVQTALKNFDEGNLSERALALFETLGYDIRRSAPFEEKNARFFQNRFSAGLPAGFAEKAAVDEWKYVDFLFQLTSEEMAEAGRRFQGGKFDQSIIDSYLFFAIDLAGHDYSRTTLSKITREVNKVFQVPVMLVFRYGGRITLAMIHRRVHKRDPSKDVLEKVVLIKDIRTDAPHRAHVEILCDLCLSQIREHFAVENFVQLHAAWMHVLGTRELNIRFYKELLHWYDYAMEHAVFPGASLEADPEGLFADGRLVRKHRAENLIRLLTRVLFVWFVKEKGLIPEELFDKEKLQDYIAFGDPKETVYYKAVLQNLFFATLNQETGKRAFRKEKQHKDVTTLLRYKSCFKKPDAFFELLNDTVPFLNGGLFDCVVARDGADGCHDGFSDAGDNPLSIPDELFFGREGFQGLIPLLKSYKFTVAENTPIEEDVALDPELLGRVFENLLASFNPETETDARNQSGSFYTPRDIVDSMVNETLKRYFLRCLENDTPGSDRKKTEAKIDSLLSYSSRPEEFSDREKELLVHAVDSCRIIDPACGSGAFPMGMLHKMTHVLHVLDPDNTQWKSRQIEKAGEDENALDQNQAVEEIETAFARNELDYPRKLYLIENCIFGVDLQPVAIQICKLRFFISLIVDQKTDRRSANFGIRALPNLETNFVAANTLQSVDNTRTLFDDKRLREIEGKIAHARHRLFSAKTPSTKKKWRENENALRKEMAAILVESGTDSDAAGQLATWNPHDSNRESSFFDAQWMFGIDDGFDIVIGNPPYIDSEMMTNLGLSGLRTYCTRHYPFARGNWDIYIAFYNKAFLLAKENGIIAFITQDKWLGKQYGKELRHRTLPFLVLLYRSGRNVFESVNVDSVVAVFEKGKGDVSSFRYFKSLDAEIDPGRLIDKGIFTDPYQLDIVYSEHLDVLLELKTRLQTLKDTGAETDNACAAADVPRLKEIMRDSTATSPAPGEYRIVNTGTIDKFVSKWGKREMKYDHDRFERPVVDRSCFHRTFTGVYGERPQKPKLIIKGMTLLDAMVDLEGGVVPAKTTLIVTGPNADLLLALSVLLNSKLGQFYIKESNQASSFNTGITFTKSMIDTFPVPAPLPTALLAPLAAVLVELKRLDNDRLFSFFYSISNAVVHELYFPNETKKLRGGIMDFLDFSRIVSNASTPPQFGEIQKTYQVLSNDVNISKALANQQKSKLLCTINEYR